jgi:hypothetical protein
MLILLTLAIGENLPIVPPQAPLFRAASVCRFRDNDARFFLAPSKTAQDRTRVLSLVRAGL